MFKAQSVDADTIDATASSELQEPWLVV